MKQVLLQNQGKLAVSPLVHLVSLGICADTKLKKNPLLSISSIVFLNIGVLPYN